MLNVKRQILSLHKNSNTSQPYVKSKPWKTLRIEPIIENPFFRQFKMRLNKWFWRTKVRLCVDHIKGAPKSSIFINSFLTLEATSTPFTQSFGPGAIFCLDPDQVLEKARIWIRFFQRVCFGLSLNLWIRPWSVAMELFYSRFWPE